MGKRVILFAGQGAQNTGMGKSLAEHSKAAAGVFALADKVLGGVSDLCFNCTKEQLKITVNTQPAVFAVDLAAALALDECGVRFDAAAGFSLGEAAALVYTGILTEEQGFLLIKERAAAMNACAEKTAGGMAAVLGLPDAKVEEIAKSVGAWCVNFNCPGQVVVAAKIDDVPKVVDAAKLAGGRAMRLEVSGAFHSPLMFEAGEALRKYLANIPFQAPRIPLYANLTAQPYTGKAVDKELFAKQCCNPVQWTRALQNLWQAGFDTFVEAGCGKVLSGLVKKTLPEAKVFNVEDNDSLNATVAALK